MTTLARFTGRLLLAAVMAALMVAGAVFGADRAAAATWRGKVAPSVLTQATDGNVAFMIQLRERADLSPADLLIDGDRRNRFVVGRLQQTAAASQAAVIARLSDFGVDYVAYWVANLIWAEGDLEVVRAIARMGDVAYLHANSSLRSVPSPLPAPALPSATSGVEWNVSAVNATLAWDAGFRGQGVVVGGQDTGYDWEHPALQTHYRGWNGTDATHDYNWHDAIHAKNPGSLTADNVCGYDATEPCDDYGHGTHTMGIMVGDDGLSNQIGVAPGAAWIGCRNMEEGLGTVQTYTECFQWFLEPTDLAGANPNRALAPQIINNSWACPSYEGCVDVTVLQQVVQNVRAAGILVVASAGNAGPSCGTVAVPPAIYDAAFSVGATDSNDNIVGFSSRGPVTADGSGRLKPDLVAPGYSIRSSLPDGLYGLKSGTSMAAPHVAGVAALMLSAQPALAGNVDAVEQILIETSFPRTTEQLCGGIPGNQIPNNTYGYGRVDAWAAVQAALAWTPPYLIYQPLLITP